MEKVRASHGAGGAGTMDVKQVGRVIPRNHTTYLFGVDNEVRTRDLNLGKVALYQLSYVHIGNQY